MDEYQIMDDELDEIEGILAYDSAKASGDEIIPFDQAVDEIEQGRQESAS